MKFYLSVLLMTAVELQAQTTGAIDGRITDPSGNGVPGATVNVRDTLTGATRRVAANGAGHYLVPNLYPGIFDVSVSHSGFQERVRTGIGVEPSRVVRVDFPLTIGQPTEKIVVTAEPPLVDPSASFVAPKVSQEQFAGLPLNGRDLFELAAQQPGVVPLKQTRRGGVNGVGNRMSVNGSRLTSNSFRLDGIIINDSTGAATAGATGGVLGVESIRELEIVSHPYSAEYGQTAGAVISAASKAGTNVLHGSGYEYFRNSRLDAKNFFDRPAEKIPRLQRNQFGASVGGPAVRDKLFYFANYEGVREGYGETLRPPVPNAAARQGQLPGRVIPVAPSVRPFLSLYPMPNGRDFGDGSAEFVNESLRVLGENLAVVKSDWLLSPSLRLSGRYTHLNSSQEQPDPVRVFTLNTDSNLRAGFLELQQVASARTIHTARFGFTRSVMFERARQADSIPASTTFIAGQPLGAIEVTGIQEIGPFIVRSRPRRHTINAFQVTDDWTTLRGQHSLRAGGGFDRIQLNQLANISAWGFYQFASLADLLAAAPRQVEVMLPGSDASRGWRQNRVSAYAQDDWRIAPRVTLGLGLRYETSSTPNEVDGKVSNIRNYLTDTAVVTGTPLWRNPSKRNFAPRASLAWDVTGGGRTVFRAGAGIFYDLLGVRDVLITGVRMPPYFNRAIATNPSFPDVLAAVRSVPPGNSLDTTDFNLNQPYVSQWNASLERQIGGSMVVRLSYSGSRGAHLMSQVNEANPVRPTLVNGRYFFPVNGARLNPAFGSMPVRRTQFNSFYHGLGINVERRFRHGVRFQTSYTRAKSIDEYSGGIVADFDYSDRMPMMFDYRQNRGPSDYDFAHVWTGNASWRVRGGWELHALARAQSGPAFGPFAGFDRARVAGARLDLGQRPDLAGRPSTGGDVSRYFDPFAYGLPEAGYYGNLGRNTLRAPGLVNVDLGLHKSFPIGEKLRATVRAESFNVTNHPNLGVPSGLALFNNTGARLGTAGRITSTVTPSRQSQFSLRFEF